MKTLNLLIQSEVLVNKEHDMQKNKSIDYILGMITGASLMLAFWACTNTPLGASRTNVQEIKMV